MAHLALYSASVILSEAFGTHQENSTFICQTDTVSKTLYSAVILCTKNEARFVTTKLSKIVIAMVGG